MRGDASLESQQVELLRAWPTLTKDEAAQRCVQLQRLAATQGQDAARFTAACQRGLAGQKVEVTPGAEPHLVGTWLMVEREGALRGVQVAVPALVEAVQRTLLQRGAMVEGEALRVFPLTPTLSPGGEREELKALVPLELVSAPLDEAQRAVRSALVGKTVLLSLTALLGLGVVLLARLAARRREETLIVQREFIATVSHELRTPLAGIRLLAETLERKLGPESAARDYPRRLVVAADALGFLVENILSFNRLEAGRWAPRRTPFPPAALQSMLEEDAGLAGDVAVEVRCDGLEALPPLSVDPELFRVLVLNLLRNAWRYAVRRPVTFTVQGAREGEVTVLRFIDNGPGIPPEAWERVFEAFHRLERREAPTRGGSGLGLALARRIAVLHGGTLRVSASSEAGTTFELRL